MTAPVDSHQSRRMPNVTAGSCFAPSAVFCRLRGVRLLQADPSVLSAAGRSSVRAAR